MKKTITFITLFNLANAFGGISNPVLDQVNITNSSIQTALEEMKQNRDQAILSYDTQIKLSSFNKEATNALVRFNQEVTTRVLQPLSPLVSQYNKIFNDNSISWDQRKILLENLRNQFTTIEIDKSNTYKQVVNNLYLVLPDFPIFESRNSFTEYWGDYYFSRRLFSNINYSVIYTKSGLKEITLKKIFAPKEIRHDVTYSSYSSAPGEAGIDPEKLLPYYFNFSTQNLRNIILEDCYTSNCYFSIHGQYTLWNTLVKSVLGRNIVIKLDDGNRITISTEDRSMIDISRKTLNAISTTEIINDLPIEISKERHGILSQIDKNNLTCTQIKRLKERLCQETQEGCMKESEKILLMNRYNRSVDCL